MSLLAVPIIAVLALFIVLFTSTILFIYLTKLKNRIIILNMEMQGQSLLVNELQALNNKLQQEFDEMVKSGDKQTAENFQVHQQLEHRIKNLQQQAIEQQQLFTQWQESQGQDKFYNRAFKLAEKGADIEEIISECELPRAEVEMLLSVYHQRIRAQ
jgi:polyhydroxyalkanoate synthesis regulator phasin